MDYKYIEQLIERYFEAETTLHEEQILKSFFAQNQAQLPPTLQKYEPMFSALHDERHLDDAFDQRLLAMTEDAPRVKARTISMAQRLRPLFGAAAVVAIVLTLSNAINQSFQSQGIWRDADTGMQASSQADMPTAATDTNSDDSLLLATESLGRPLRADSLLRDSLLSNAVTAIE